MNTPEGVRKAHESIRSRYGLDHYRKAGSKGGLAKTDKPKGFAIKPFKSKEHGKYWGKRSRKGYTFLGESDGKWLYKHKVSGEYMTLDAR